MQGTRSAQSPAPPVEQAGPSHALDETVPGAGFRNRLTEPLADHFPVILITALYLAAGRFAAGVLGWPVEAHPLPALANVGFLLAWLLALAVGATLFVLALASVARWVARRRGRQPVIPSWADLRPLITPNHLVELVLVFALYVLFIDTFIGFKRALPAIQPFAWDAAFMRLDQALHFGRHPWEILQPVLGRPIVTSLVDAVYYTWFAVNMLCLAGFLWVSNRVLKTQFYVSFWLVWIVLGTVMAYALSSVGPCYFGLVTAGVDPFQPLMTYLRGVDQTHGLLAVFTQGKLWEDYSGGTSPLLMKGISAMPSVHIALPVLYTIAGWRVHRALGIAFAVFAFIIFLGSIHLGWHYAIDGYASALAVPVIWWVSGIVVRSYSRCLDGATDRCLLRPARST